MQIPKEKRVRRSQRDYSLAFKLAVVGEVARGELRKKQAQHRYGIQGRSTVLVWCRKYATHFATFQVAGRTSPDAPLVVEQTPEQLIKQLRDQKRQYEQQLKDSAELNLLLRTMLQVVVDHDIPLPKKSFRRPFPVSKPPNS